MKTLALMILLSILVACNGRIDDTKKNNIEIPETVTLTHRLKKSCAYDSCRFDFFNMQQIYGYGLSLEFGNSYTKNMLDTELVVDEFGKIVSLGKISCHQYTEDNPYDRTLEPRDWLNYSNAWSKLQESGQGSLDLEEGHCYLVYKSSSDHRIIFLFHVRELQDLDYVILDEIEVLDRDDF